jgi:hypothetical protein
VSPIAIALTSSSRCSGNLHRQRLDVHLACDLRERAALAHAGRVLARDEHDGHGRRDRLVETDLLQVDVDELSAERILLVVLEDRRVSTPPRRRDDVEDRVHPAPPVSAPRSSRSGIEIAMRLRRPGRRECPGSAPACAACALARPGALAGRHFKLDPFAGHYGG